MHAQSLIRSVSRRRFLLASVVTTSGLAVSSLLQACGSATAPSPTAASAPAAPTAAPPTTAPAAPATAPTATTAAPAAANSAATATPAQAAKPSGEKVTLTHWAHPLSKDDSTIFNPIIDQFKQATPNVDVKIELVPWSNRIEKVMSAVTANTPPDTSYVNVDEFTTYVAQDALAPLDSYLAGSKVDVNDFVQGPRDAMTWKGKAYEIPVLYAFRVAYYNTDIWKQAGLDATKSPTTWDEYTKTMDQLKDAKASGKIKAWPTWLAVLSEIPVGNFNPWFYQAGGKFLTSEGKCGYSSDAGMTALKFMMKTFKDYCNPSDAGDKGEDLVSAFGQQQYAYQNNFELSMIKQVGHDFATTNFDVANTLQGKVRWTHGGVGAQGIFSGSKFKDQTWQWVNFLTSGKANLDYNVGFGFVPPRTSVLTDYKATVTDKKYLRALDEAQYGGIEKSPGLWDAWAIVSPMIQAALLGKMEPEAALKSAADKINADVLSKYPA